MRFTIGIYTKEKLDGSYMVCAATWNTKKPDFSLSQATLSEMKKKLISLVCTEGKKESIAINAAIARTVEILFFKGYVANPLNDYPPILIHAPASARVIQTKYKFTPVRGCWLMNCAKRALEEFYVARYTSGRRHATACGRSSLRALPEKIRAGRPRSIRTHLSGSNDRPKKCPDTRSRAK
jgi:hypothetical protein